MNEYFEKNTNYIKIDYNNTDIDDADLNKIIVDQLFKNHFITYKKQKMILRPQIYNQKRYTFYPNSYMQTIENICNKVEK